MKFTLGASGIFYLIVGLSFAAFFLLLPYPHYDPPNSRWYLGISIGSRLTGGVEQGVPLDKVFQEVTRASVSSPFEISCNTNEDCKTFVVLNQCRVYCGNSGSGNGSIQTTLGNNRVCDPALWRTPSVTCSCVYGNCVNLE